MKLIDREEIDCLMVFYYIVIPQFIHSFVSCSFPVFKQSLIDVFVISIPVKFFFFVNTGFYFLLDT